jgi:hypothetical protein
MAEMKFEVPDGIGEGLFSEPSGEGLRVLVQAVAQALINAQADSVVYKRFCKSDRLSRAKGGHRIR